MIDPAWDDAHLEYQIMIAKRAEEIRPFIVMDVLERAQALEKSGEHIIHLEVGEPDFDTPASIRAAGDRALADGKTHYTHSLGLLNCGRRSAAITSVDTESGCHPSRSSSPPAPPRPCCSSLAFSLNPGTR
jgi:hypothetical protein